MTRAKEELHLTVPQRFYVNQQSAHGDRHVYALRSRFIPDELTALFETSAWPLTQQATQDTRMPPCPAAAVDIGAQVRARWR